MRIINSASTYRFTLEFGILLNTFLSQSPPCVYGKIKMIKLFCQWLKNLYEIIAHGKCLVNISNGTLHIQMVSNVCIGAMVVN